MKKETIETLFNPLVMKIIIVFLDNGQVTTKDLLDVLSVPQATLYRQIAKLEKSDIIEVIKKEHKRGAYEKTYQLKYDPIRAMGEIATKGTTEEHKNLFFMFMMSILNQFNSYVEQENFDIIEDHTGFRTYPLYMTKEENKAFIKDFGELLRKYVTNKNNDERMLYSFSFVHIKGEER